MPFFFFLLFLSFSLADSSPSFPIPFLPSFLLSFSSPPSPVCIEGIDSTPCYLHLLSISQSPSPPLSTAGSRTRTMSNTEFELSQKADLERNALSQGDTDKSPAYKDERVLTKREIQGWYGVSSSRAAFAFLLSNQPAFCPSVRTLWGDHELFLFFFNPLHRPLPSYPPLARRPSS